MHFCRYGCYVRVTLRLRVRCPSSLRTVTGTLYTRNVRNGVGTSLIGRFLKLVPAAAQKSRN